jgi:dodecin
MITTIYTMSSASTIGEIVELVGSSDKSWEDAAQIAVKEAVKTIRNVHGIEVLDKTAKVDPNTGNIKEYRVGIKLAFGIER